MNEFDAIARYFRWPTPSAALGAGDDCALWAVPEGQQLAISSDMLVSGRHFFADTDPYGLGHKALAVNLSDLAAMGARPVAFTLALALPQLDADWLSAFAQGMRDLAQAHGCELIGGDTTAGPLTISITVLGHVPVGAALRRDGARAGDDLYISGHIGDARLALQQRLSEGLADASPWVLSAADRAHLSQRLERPQARVALGLALRGVASAAMDLSDGLAGDLAHLLHASGCGATVRLADLPLSPVLRALPPHTAQTLAACGGDDYELLFCAPPSARAAIDDISQRLGLALTRVGCMDKQAGMRLLDTQGLDLAPSLRGFDHFA